MEWLIFIVAYAFGAITMIGGNRRDVQRIRADRDQWRRKADKATAMVDYFIGIAMDGSIHPHPHVCGQPGEGTYEECRECWLNAATDAVEEATDER